MQYLSPSVCCLCFLLVLFGSPTPTAANILAVDSSYKLKYQPGALICSLAEYNLTKNPSNFGSILTTAFSDCVITIGKGAGRATVEQQVVLVVPPGTYYLTTSVTLKNGVNWMLHLNGSQILYTSSVGGYAFVINNANQFVLSGDYEGSLNATLRGSLNGQAWLYPQWGSNTRLLKLQSGYNITIGRLNLIKSPAYSFVVDGTNYLEVFEVLINGVAEYGATDGMDISASNAFIHDVQVSDGDECVTTKNPSSNVLVENVLCMGASGCSFGSFGQAATSNLSGIVAISNITYRNIYMQGGYGWGMKICTTNNGLIENITLQNLIVDGANEPIGINFYWSCSSLPSGAEPGAGNLTVRNLHITNVTGSQSSSSRNPAFGLICDPSATGKATCVNVSVTNFNVWPSGSNTVVDAACQYAVGTLTNALAPTTGNLRCFNSTSYQYIKEAITYTTGTVPAPTWGLIQYPLAAYPKYVAPSTTTTSSAAEFVTTSRPADDKVSGSMVLAASLPLSLWLTFLAVLALFN